MRELALAAIDDDEIGQCFFRVRKAAAQDFLHHGEIVRALDRADFVTAVKTLIGRSVDKNDARSDGILALRVGDVVALDSMRELREMKFVLNLFETFGPVPLSAVLGLLERVFGVGFRDV